MESKKIIALQRNSMNRLKVLTLALADYITAKTQETEYFFTEYKKLIVEYKKLEEKTNKQSSTKDSSIEKVDGK